MKYTQKKHTGKSEVRVDAFDKATGRAKYYEDLMPTNALFAKIKHADICHGRVKKIDTSAAEAIPGVVRVLTCFEVPDCVYGTAGHPFALKEEDRDISDRHLLNEHVRYFGDDIAVVIAEDEIAAVRGVDALEVEYEEYTFALEPQDAMKPEAANIHEKYPDNVLAHIHNDSGDFEAIAAGAEEQGLKKVEGWYETPTVQHSHIEPFGCFAYMENGRYVATSSTQIPHITRRLVSDALGEPIGKVRVIKPYVGGGFGNKQDMLYEGLCAWCTKMVHGRVVRIDCTREETFTNNRVRHAMKFHFISYLDKDGKIIARKVEQYSKKGAYASHGGSITVKAFNSIPQMYPVDNYVGDAYCVFTNTVPTGAMRGYGIPQVTFAIESHTDDCAKVIGMSPYDFRMQNIMADKYKNEYDGNCNYFDSFRACLKEGRKRFDYDAKLEEYKGDTGNIRRGVGMASFWYNTGVFPHSLEHSSCRMLLNLDGTVTVQIGETEIGQGADTAYAQMTAEAVGLSSYKDVNVDSTQDTDTTPLGLGAYASRQTYVVGFAIEKTAESLRKMIKERAVLHIKDKPERFESIFNVPEAVEEDELDIVDGWIVIAKDSNNPNGGNNDNPGQKVISLGDLAYEVTFCKTNSKNIAVEESATIRSNAYSFGCTFADVTVDIAACKVKVNKMMNVHDCGELINPALAEAQVHGGMSMGLGYSAFENLMFDEKTGRVLNGNFLDYKLPTFNDYVDFEAVFLQNAEPTNPFGTKALGEPPNCSPAAAVRNAFLNATGVAVNQNPLNPHKLHEVFAEKEMI